MIVFNRVSKSVGSRDRFTVVLDSVSIRIPADRKIALMSLPSGGKTTLVRLLAGLEKPSSGRIDRFVRVSLPVGGIHFKPALSARQNVHFLARSYGADPREVSDFVLSITKMVEWFDEPLHEIPRELFRMLSFALAYALPFDVYLIDGIPAAGPRPFRDKCLAMLAERSREAGIILATSDARIARRFCDCALILHGKGLQFYSELEEGLARFGELAASETNLSGLYT